MGLSDEKCRDPTNTPPQGFFWEFLQQAIVEFPVLISGPVNFWACSLPFFGDM